MSLKPNHVSKEQLERVITAMTHEMSITDVTLLHEDYDTVLSVEDLESKSGEPHTVNLDELTCDCSDSKYNLLDDEYCKHVYKAVLYEAGILES